MEAAFIMLRQTIGELVWEIAASRPDDTGLEFDGVSYTWRQIDMVSDALAARLYAAGIKSGDYVGIFGQNSDRWYFNFLALMKLDARAVLLNTCFKFDDIIYAIKKSDISYLLYSDSYDDNSFEEIAAELIKTGIMDKSRLLPMELDCADPGFLNTSVYADNLPKERDSDEIAAVLFTSGSVSKPKGVMLSHYSLVNNAKAQADILGWQFNDSMLVTVPLFHCFGLTTCILGSLLSGLKIILSPRISSKQIMRLISEKKPTIFNGVPSMYLAMLKKYDPEAGYDLSSVRSGVIAGSAVSKKDYERIVKLFPKIDLRPAYGMTEMSPCVSISRKEDPECLKMANAARPIDGVDVRIENHIDLTETGSAGKSGEILVKGYGLMKAYINSPEETRKSFNDDGYFKTGDYGHMDKDGYLFVTGRLKDLIIRGGENISPAEVEEAIKEVFKAGEVTVVGVPSEVLQEEVVALVEGSYSEEAEKNILNGIKDKLAYYKIPKCIYFLDTFPKLASGKTDRKKLRAYAAKKFKENL